MDLTGANRAANLMFFGSAIALVSCVAGNSAFAQSIGASRAPGVFGSSSNAETAASGQTNLEEIIVTARKRQETLLNVPISMTAVSAAKVEALGIQNLADLSKFTPGFYFTDLANGRNDRSTTSLRFRGMATSGVNSPDTNLATLFVDGVAITGGSQPPIEDVDRVEVIKGPQSAYFGRATFAGAVNYITRNPGNEWIAKANASVGNYGMSDVSLSLEGPLVDNKLAFRIYGRNYQTDGQYVNVADPSQRLGAQKTDTISLILYATPTDKLSIKGRVEFTKDEDGPSAAIQYGQERANCRFGPSLQPYFCGTIGFPPSNLIGYNTDFTPLTYSQLIQNNAHFNVPFVPKDLLSGFGYGRESYQTSLSINYELPHGATFSTILAYNHDREIFFDGAGRDANNFPNNPYGSFPVKQIWQYYGEEVYNDYSIEARISSSDTQRLRWLVGVNYLHSYNVNGNAFFSPYGYVQFPDSLPLRNEPDTVGGFGSLAYDILQNLTLSLEGRYQWDHVEQQATGGPVLDAHYLSFLPRVILNYKPDPDLNFYVSYARGNRPGFFNATISTLTPAQAQIIYQQTGATLAEPESTLIDYEGGVKGALWGGRAQFNVDGYFMKWENQRAAEIGTLPSPPPGPAFINVQVQTAVGLTDLFGIEFEGAFKLDKYATISGTFDWADSNIRNFNCAACLAIIGTNNVNGNKTPRVPEFTGSLVFNYERSFMDTGFDWFVSPVYTYTGTIYESELNLAQTGAANKFDIHLGLENSRWRIEAYVKNIFNDKTVQNLDQYVDLYAPGYDALALALPELRTFGIRLKVKL